MSAQESVPRGTPARFRTGSKDLERARSAAALRKRERRYQERRRAVTNGENTAADLITAVAALAVLAPVSRAEARDHQGDPAGALARTWVTLTGHEKVRAMARGLSRVKSGAWRAPWALAHISSSMADLLAAGKPGPCEGDWRAALERGIKAAVEAPPWIEIEIREAHRT